MKTKQHKPPVYNVDPVVLKKLLFPERLRGRKTEKETANKNGRALERDAFDIFTLYGLPMLPESPINSAKLYKHGYKELIGISFNTLSEEERNNWTGFLFNCEFTKLTGRVGKTEFVKVISGKKVMRMECRVQNVSGSAEDKIEAAICRFMTNCYPEPKFMLITDGNYITPERIRSYQTGFDMGLTAIKSFHNKDAYVISINEIIDNPEIILKLGNN